MYVCESTRVIECNVVAKFESNRWKSFGYCFGLHRFLARYGCRIYTKRRSYSNWTLCQNLEVIGEAVSELWQKLQTYSYIFIYKDLEKYCSVGHATADNAAHAHCMLDNSVYIHPLRMSNTIYTSVATMVRQKPLNVRLYVRVYCLSCNCDGQCLGELETKFYMPVNLNSGSKVLSKKNARL
jgi:hypothetical protein